jgi:hypothetical protein
MARRLHGVTHMNFLLGAFLVGHALIHASYLTPAPPRTADGPEWPFEMAQSWLVTGAGLDPAVVRTLGTALVLTTIALLVAAGLSTVGWLVPPEWWSFLVVGGGVASALTLAMFFHPWIVLGLVIDAALLWVAVGTGWTPTVASP